MKDLTFAASVIGEVTDEFELTCHSKLNSDCPDLGGALLETQGI